MLLGGAAGGDAAEGRRSEIRYQDFGAKGDGVASDQPAAESYRGPELFGDFKADPSGGAFPYAPTREVLLKHVSTASGLPLRISDQPAVFADTKVLRE